MNSLFLRTTYSIFRLLCLIPDCIFSQRNRDDEIFVERIQFIIFPEFFVGEKELFEQIENLTYAEKVIAFMSTFFYGTDYFYEFEHVIKEYFYPDINDNVFSALYPLY